jgi:hypothetical protein
MSGSPKRETHVTEWARVSPVVSLDPPHRHFRSARHASGLDTSRPAPSWLPQWTRHATDGSHGTHACLRPSEAERGGAAAWRCGRSESQPGAGRHHRGTSRADSGDDLLGIDSLEVDRGRAEVGVAELALVLLASRPMPKPERSGVCPIAAPTRTEPSTHPSRELMPSPGRPDPTPYCACRPCTGRGQSACRCSPVRHPRDSGSAPRAPHFDSPRVPGGSVGSDSTTARSPRFKTTALTPPPVHRLERHCA